MRGGSVRGCQGFCLVWGPSRIGGCTPTRASEAGTLGERDVLAGGAGQNMIDFLSPPAGGGNSARRALPGGEPTPQGSPCAGPNPAPARGSAVLCVPFGWAGRLPALGAAPWGPCLPGRGSPFLPRNGEKEGRGFALDPGFYSPLAVARSFWGSFSLIRSRGYSLRYAKTDLGRIFPGNMLKKHFSKESFQIRARRWVTK